MKLPVILLAVVATAINSTSATAGESQPKQKNYVSATSIFGRVLKGVGGASDKSINEYGVTAKIGLADNISIRPFISAGTGSSREENIFGVPFEAEFSNATFGVAATYDMNIKNSEFTPYAGIGYSSSTAKASIVGTSRSGELTTSNVYLEVGTDYQLPDSRVVLNANYKLQDGGGLFGISVGYGF